MAAARARGAAGVAWRSPAAGSSPAAARQQPGSRAAPLALARPAGASLCCRAASRPGTSRSSRSSHTRSPNLPSSGLQGRGAGEGAVGERAGLLVARRPRTRSWRLQEQQHDSADSQRASGEAGRAGRAASRAAGSATSSLDKGALLCLDAHILEQRRRHGLRRRLGVGVQVPALDGHPARREVRVTGWALGRWAGALGWDIRVGRWGGALGWVVEWGTGPAAPEARSCGRQVRSSRAAWAGGARGSRSDLAGGHEAALLGQHRDGGGQEDAAAVQALHRVAQPRGVEPLLRQAPGAGGELSGAPRRRGRGARAGAPRALVAAAASRARRGARHMASDVRTFGRSRLGPGRRGRGRRGAGAAAEPLRCAPPRAARPGQEARQPLDADAGNPAAAPLHAAPRRPRPRPAVLGASPAASRRSASRRSAGIGSKRAARGGQRRAGGGPRRAACDRAACSPARHPRRAPAPARPPCARPPRCPPCGRRVAARAPAARETSCSDAALSSRGADARQGAPGREMPRDRCERGGLVPSCSCLRAAALRLWPPPPPLPSRACACQPCLPARGENTSLVPCARSKWAAAGAGWLATRTRTC